MGAYSDVRRVEAMVTFNIIDETAAPDASLSGSAQSEISQIGQVINGVRNQGKKIGTPEPKQLLLDGTFEILPDNYSNIETGYRSLALSNKLGEISQTLTAKFKNKHSAHGITIFFDEKAREFATKIKVTAWNGASLIKSEIFENSKEIATCHFDVEDFDKIELTFLKTNNPFRKIRVIELVFGVIEIFDKDNLKELRILRELSGDMQAFPAGEIELTFSDPAGRYDVINKEGIYKHLRQGKALEATMGIGGESGELQYVDLGKFFFYSASSGGNGTLAKITAYDATRLLEGLETVESTSSGATRLKQRVEWELSFLNLPFQVRAIFEDGTENVLINDRHDVMSYREFFRQAAQAAQCTCFFDTSGNLVFKKLKTFIHSADTLDANNLHRFPELIAQRQYNTCIVKNKQGEIGRYSEALPGEEPRILEVQNQLVTLPDAIMVARWILKRQQKVMYKAVSRGNPYIDIGNCISIYDSFGRSRNAVIAKEDFTYDGALKADVTAIADY